LAKRHNFHASIQGFPELWGLYFLLDKIIVREFEDLTTRPDLKKLFPLFLYIEAHVKIRASMELALSVCLPEARSILRDGIGFVAHAHHMIEDCKVLTHHDAVSWQIVSTCMKILVSRAWHRASERQRIVPIAETTAA
jgi:hypothetical protein